MLDAPDLAPSRSPLALAPWHEARPHLVANAMMAARRAAPHLVALADWLLPHVPRRPLASQSIRTDTPDRHSDPFLLDEGVGLPWIALDSRTARNVLAIDIDHTDGPERAALFVAYGLPRPTLIVDPWTARSHAVWRLTTPVITSERSRLGPRILADLAGRLLAAVLRGTLMPSNCLVKSPWGEEKALIGRVLHRGPRPVVPLLAEAHREAASGLAWHTEPGDLRTLELREVVAALADDFGGVIEPSRRHRRRSRPEPSSLGRNCELFDLVRWWAYDRGEVDGTAIADEAERVNKTFSPPLPQAEVRATARSIARFMATRWKGTGGEANRQRGRDAEAGADLDAHQRRQLAGQRSAEHRTAATDTRIATAVATLRAGGHALTQAAIAAEAGLGVRTVRRRWNRPIGAVSGNAAGAPSLPSKNLPSSTRSSDDTVAAAYRDQAARLRRPGATPEPVAPVRTGASTFVQDAHAKALGAAASARRRQEARRRAAEGRQRRADRETWHRAHAADTEAWGERLAAIRARHRLAIERAEEVGLAVEITGQIHRSIIGAELRARARATAAYVAPRRSRRLSAIPNTPDEFDQLSIW